MMTENTRVEELMQEHQTLLNALFLELTALRGACTAKTLIFAAATATR